MVRFLNQVMERRRCKANQLADSIGVSGAAVSRWLSGKDMPNIQSCHRLAEYSDEPLIDVLHLAGHIPHGKNRNTRDLPQFREYARIKYDNELDEDVITLIEDLIERRRTRKKTNST